MRLINPANPRWESPSLSNFEPIIGDRVRATMPETITAPANVNANSRKSAPVSPPWIATGVYTAASVMVIAMMGPTSSRAASSAARIGVAPICKWRSTFSTITMASSTTNPTESTIASKVSRLIVKPAASMMNTAPIKEIGMATIGISTDRNDPRNKKITMTTISSVSPSVCKTSLMASWIYAVES